MRSHSQRYYRTPLAEKVDLRSREKERRYLTLQTLQQTMDFRSIIPYFLALPRASPLKAVPDMLKFSTKIISALMVTAILVMVPDQVSASSSLWVWVGQSPHVQDDFDALYVFQGQFSMKGRYRYDFEGSPPQKLDENAPPLVLTYRLQSLVPPKMVASRYRAHARAWRKRGVKVEGIQIDYDSPTSKLLMYANWIGRLRNSIESGAKISVTGLGDWLVSAAPGDLASLFMRTNHIAFMMYHGRNPLEPVLPYTAVLSNTKSRFKIGLLKSQWNSEAFKNVRSAPGYLGAIQFILPEDRK